MGIKRYIIHPAVATNLIAYAITRNPKYLGYLATSIALKAVYHNLLQPNENLETGAIRTPNDYSLLYKAAHGAIKITYGLSAGLAIGDLTTSYFSTVAATPIPAKYIGAATRAATTFLSRAHLQDTPMHNSEYGFRAVKAAIGGMIEDSIGIKALIPNSILRDGVIEGGLSLLFASDAKGKDGLSSRQKPIQTFLCGLLTGSAINIAFKGLTYGMSAASEIHPVIAVSAEIMSPIFKKFTGFVVEYAVWDKTPDFKL